jgi:hypothetical protein
MFLRELRWFFGALLLSAVLSFVFYFLLGTIEEDIETKINFSWKLYFTGLIVMLLNIYAGRFILQTVRDHLG